MRTARAILETGQHRHIFSELISEQARRCFEEHHVKHRKASTHIFREFFYQEGKEKGTWAVSCTPLHVDWQGLSGTVG